MSRILIVFALLCAGLSILTFGSYASPNDEHQGANDSSVQQVNLVVQWNRTLLAIVRTPGAQPATVHPTRSFAILHAAIYDAVNAIDRTRTPYLVQVRRAPPSHVTRCRGGRSRARCPGHVIPVVACTARCATPTVFVPRAG